MNGTEKNTLAKEKKDLNGGGEGGTFNTNWQGEKLTEKKTGGDNRWTPEKKKGEKPVREKKNGGGDTNKSNCFTEWGRAGTTTNETTGTKTVQTTQHNTPALGLATKTGEKKLGWGGGKPTGPGVRS